MQNRKSTFYVIATAALVVLIAASIFIWCAHRTNKSDELFASLPSIDVTDVCSEEGYELEQMLIISRHNIRSPISGGDSLLSQITPHEWFAWTSEPGELSVKGGQLETSMGQFFRKYLENRRFIPANWIPEDGEVRFYANSIQRTIATAQFFAAGMLPVANVDIEYHKEYGEMDLIFCPYLRCNSPEFETRVRKEIDAMGGEEGILGISRDMKASFELLEEVLDFKNSKYAKENGISHIPLDDISIKFVEGGDIGLSGGLKLASSAVDALKLQIYEEEKLDKALFGHELTAEQIQDISMIGDAYQEICEGYILHRIIKVREKDYVIVGDNCFRKEYGITDSQILRVLTGIVRNGKHISVTDKKYLGYVHIWCDFYPVRAGILYTRAQLGRIKSKLARMIHIHSS